MSVQSATKQFEGALADAKHNLAAAHEAVVSNTAEVTRLENALNALRGILLPQDFSADAKATKGKTKKATKAHKAMDMPVTSADFWLGLITPTKQKTGDILAAAAEKLGITDDERIAVLKSRMASNLTNLIGEKKIKSEGERANRKYFV